MIKPPVNSIKKAILNYKSYISQHKCHIPFTPEVNSQGGGGGTSISGGRGAWPQIFPLKFLLEPQILPPKI